MSYKEKNVKKKLPSTISECIKTLDEFLSDEDKAYLLSLQEESAPNAFFNSLGRYIRNEWGLWTESDLSKYFQSLGFRHPWQISSTIIISYWRVKHKLPIRLTKRLMLYERMFALSIMKQALKKD